MVVDRGAEFGKSGVRVANILNFNVGQALALQLPPVRENPRTKGMQGGAP